MTATLRMMLTADYAGMLDGNKPLLAGVFDTMIVAHEQQRAAIDAGAPIPVPPYYIFARVVGASEDRTEKSIVVRLIDGDALEIKRVEMVAKFAPGYPGQPSSAHVFIHVNGVGVPRCDVYEWEIAVDGVRLGSTPLTILPAPSSA